MTLHEWRKSAGLTLKGAAQMIGCSEATLSKWERKKQWPRRDQIRRIQVVTGNKVQAEDLV